MKILAILMLVFAIAIPLHAGIDAKGRVTAESITLGTNAPIVTWMDAISEGGGITNGSTNVDFGSLFVSANATNGTMAVNWQTMTNWVYSQGFLTVENEPAFSLWVNGNSINVGFVSDVAPAYDYAVAIGTLSSATGTANVAVGYKAIANGVRNIAIGNQARVLSESNFTDTVEIGGGIAWMNGWFHYMGYPYFDGIGSGRFSALTVGGANVVVLGGVGGWTNLSQYNNDAGFLTSASLTNVQYVYNSTNGIVFDGNNSLIYDNNGVVAINFNPGPLGARTLYDQNGASSVDWLQRRLSDGVGAKVSVDWGNRRLQIWNAGVKTMLDWSADGLIDCGTNVVRGRFAATNIFGAFGSLSVTSDATAGQQVVNWQTMTNYMSGVSVSSWSSYPATNIVRLTNNAIAYEDMLASASTAFQSGGSDISNDDTLGGKSFATSATTNIANDHLTFVYQTPHRRKSNTHADPHLHFWQTNADQTNCWFMTYTWAALGTTNYTELGPFGPASNQLAYVGGTMHQLATFPELVNTNSGISGILRIKLYRFGTRGTGAITVTDLDCHYEVDGFGSDQELSKRY